MPTLSRGVQPTRAIRRNSERFRLCSLIDTYSADGWRRHRRSAAVSLALSRCAAPHAGRRINAYEPRPSPGLSDYGRSPTSRRATSFFLVDAKCQKLHEARRFPTSTPGYGDTSNPDAGLLGDVIDSKAHGNRTHARSQSPLGDWENEDLMTSWNRRCSNPNVQHHQVSPAGAKCIYRVAQNSELLSRTNHH